MDQVQEIKDKTDIVKLIGEYVKLTKAGTNYRGNCPFHNEKTPSFMVSPELQIYKCFGCGEGGDVLTFLQNHEGMEFYEALKFLADRIGIKIKTVSGGQTSEKEILLTLNETAAKVYAYVLNQHKLGKNALKYFKEKRGLDNKIIQEFELGFAPERRDFLVNYLTKRKKFKIDDVEKAGLAVRVGGSMYDRFRGRIIFPIKDVQGRVIALAGRILPEFEKKNLAKYINSPETLIYHKSKSLYGIDKARSAIKQTGVAILVEGELDMLSSYQTGVKNVVAIKGTALTEDQIRMLSRIAKSLVVALDSDFAGDTAAMRGIRLAQTQGLDLKVSRCGEYKDPDEFARADPDGYQNSLKNAIGVWDFVIDVVCDRVDINSGSGKAKASRELVPLLAEIEDKILQAHYVGVVAKRLRVPEEAVAREIESFAHKQTLQPIQQKTEARRQSKTRRQLLEERLIALVLQKDPNILKDKTMQMLLSSPLTKKIATAYIEFAQKCEFEIKRFMNSLPQELRDGFSELILREQKTDEVDVGVELTEVIKSLKLVDNNEKREKWARKIQESEEKGNPEEIEEAQKRYAKLSEIRTELELEQK